jgi:hypothetical protein
MSREQYENPFADAAFGRARKLAHAGREAEAFEALGTALKASGWCQQIEWGRDNAPASCWESYQLLRYARELILFLMILRPREQWIGKWDLWKETVRDLVELSDRAFVLGPQRWRIGRAKPRRRLTLQDELDEIRRTAGHGVAPV